MWYYLIFAKKDKNNNRKVMPFILVDSLGNSFTIDNGCIHNSFSDKNKLH